MLEDEEKQVKVSNRVITCYDNDVIDARIGRNACRTDDTYHMDLADAQPELTPDMKEDSSKRERLVGEEAGKSTSNVKSVHRPLKGGAEGSHWIWRETPAFHVSNAVS